MSPSERQSSVLSVRALVWSPPAVQQLFAAQQEVNWSLIRACLVELEPAGLKELQPFFDGSSLRATSLSLLTRSERKYEFTNLAELASQIIRHGSFVLVNFNQSTNEHDSVVVHVYVLLLFLQSVFRQMKHEQIFSKRKESVLLRLFDLRKSSSSEMQ